METMLGKHIKKRTGNINKLSMKADFSLDFSQSTMDKNTFRLYFELHLNLSMVRSFAFIRAAFYPF